MTFKNHLVAVICGKLIIELTKQQYPTTVDMKSLRHEIMSKNDLLEMVKDILEQYVQDVENVIEVVRLEELGYVENPNTLQAIEVGQSLPKPCTFADAVSLAHSSFLPF